MFSMKQLLMGVYHVCSNKSPCVKIGPVGGGDLYTGERPQGHHGPLVILYQRKSACAKRCSRQILVRKGKRIIKNE
jgi:hypothetical protein